MMMVLAGACGDVSPQPAGTDGTFTFAEDADPAVAALEFVEKQLLVQPYPGVDAQAVTDLYADAGTKVIAELPEMDLVVLEVTGGDLAGAAESLAAAGLVETVQKNYFYETEATPDDPLFSGQPHLAQIFAPQAWDVTVGDENVVVAIVDTGLDADHPDLEEQVLGGWNAFDESADFSDVFGHGTQVAGVAAASSDNGVGVAGVAWNSPLLGVRVTDSRGRATSRHVAAGILWAAANGASVINVSFAPLWSDRVVRAAAQTAFHRGSLVVISAGNRGGTTTASGYPEALFVGALAGAERIAPFSDRGPFVDLTAPGMGVRTTRVGDDYGFANGTSFSAPIVAGVAALAWSANPELRPTTIADILLSTAVDLGSLGKDATYGEGAVDAAAAVSLAARTAFVSDETAPELRVFRPSEGMRITTRTTAVVTASDDDAVADVVMRVNGVPVATDTRAPYQFLIDPALYSPGTYLLGFVATDFSGNASEVETVEVTLAPSSGTSRHATQITFRSPPNRAVVAGDVSIQASISDRDGLAVAEWLVDGQSVLVTPVSGQSSGVSFLWRTGDALRGEHFVTLVVTDGRGVQTSGQLVLIKR